MSGPVRRIRRGAWSSQAGFIAASVGSAVGLGNVWRFPYMTGENGGGAFIVAYIVSVTLLAAPVAMFEFAAGRRFQGAAYGVFSGMSRWGRYAGVVVALTTFIIFSYYSVVAGWTLGYAGVSAFGTGTTFASFSDSWASTVLFLLALAATAAIVLAGVAKGIETSTRVLMPLLFVALAGIAIYSLTLKGRSEAVSFLFTPDFSYLAHPSVWADAMGQAMFSLGVGTGVLVTYGGYMGSQMPVRDSTAIVAGADTMISFIAGLAVFPIVFTFAVEPSSGPALAFNSLPQMFGQLAGGRFLGTIFYLLLFFAALTSMISMLEATAGSLADATNWARKRAIWVLMPPLAIVGGLSALSYSPVHLALLGEPVLDRLDGVFGTFGLMVAALATALMLFWSGKADEIAREIGEGAQGTAGRAVIFVGRYLATGVIVVTLIANVVGAFR